MTISQVLNLAKSQKINFMKEQHDLLAIQVGSGIAAVVTFVVPYISAAFMLVSIATGCVTLYEYFKKKFK